ncbi:Delta-1-pyrroline-5-carboxylate dehydrogenase [Colletotrichum sp. SAR 10_65]|nr:Delta-1-pyrroline-5-carboxylate dehydrogenase [Colletotrichum sp. SAR 10_65]KAJ4997594.1 Delta-1-pyrroline-5-carboxylate dehydrogenase [Colletotrichum sp. SAR 10_66]
MSLSRYPEPANADGFSYAPGSEERKLLKAALAEAENTTFEIPSIINGERLYTGRKSAQKNPWNHHGAPLAEYHEVDRETIKKSAIPGALDARRKWANMPFSDRAAIYKRAARLVETKYRWKLMAATMLGQGKTCGQAEGDCITEVIDTLNFHIYYCHQLYQQQPLKQSDSAYNSLDYRPLEGFVLAVSPFNFTALGAHIAFTPAILGNVVLWKPSPMAVLSNYILYQIMEEAGLPKGVVQFLPTADPTVVVELALASPHFSGLHYTGSSAVLKSLFAQIGTNTQVYKTFPRIVGESGGKNFHLVHNSCREDVDWIASAAVRSAFEFQGQKCSALSRLYVPKSMWEQGDFKAALLREAAKMTHGDDVKQLHHPLGPIVSEAAFERFGEFLENAQKDGHRLLFGGKMDGSKGLFIQPAILEANQDDKTATSDLLTRELFGPLFAVLTYDDTLPNSLEDVCDLIDSTRFNTILEICLVWNNVSDVLLACISSFRALVIRFVKKQDGVFIGQLVQAPPGSSCPGARNGMVTNRTEPSPRPSSTSRPTTKLDVFVIGSGENSELGLGPRHTQAPRPRLNRLLDANSVGVVQVAVGGMHCVALTHDGKVLTWGVNDDGALGRVKSTSKSEAEAEEDEEDILDSFESTPEAVNFDKEIDVVQVAATNSAGFALTAAGKVYGWGSFAGGDGNFGFLHEKPPKTTERLPVLIPGLTDIKELAGGSDHILALTNDGNVFAWGSGEQNELGRRILARRRFETLVPQRVGLPKNKTAKIFAGSHHSFAIDTTGKVWAFGLNNFGQCGISTREDTGFTTVISPTVIKSLEGYKVRHIGCGLHHTVACTEEGEVLVWGRADDGQMGMPLETLPEDHIIFDSRDRPRVLNVPAVVPDLKAVFVAAGIDNCYAISKEGEMHAWGFSASYNTGLATTDTVKTPTLVRSKQLGEKKLNFIDAGGQFAVATSPRL